MNKEKSLFKNTAIVSLGKICTQLISFFLLPLYTALLTTEQYGVVDLLNTLINLLVPVLMMQLDQGVFRYLIDCREDHKQQEKLISVTIFFLLAQVIIYTILFMIISPFVHNEYKYFLLSNLIVALFSSVLLQISRGLGDNMSYAIGSFLTGSATVLFNVIFIVYFHLGAYGMLLASFIGNIICIGYLCFALKIREYIHKEAYDKDVLTKLLRYSVPLIPNIISWWIVNASDRIIISFFMNLSANGIYSAANKFPGVITTLYSVFNLTWTESAAININARDRDEFFSHILTIILSLFGAICLNVISLMPFIFPIMINQSYGEAYNQIPILMIGTMFNIMISFLGSIYVAKKLTGEVAKTSIFAAIINVSINVIFIKIIGLYAASFSTAIAYFSMFVYRIIDVRKYVHLSVKKSLLISLILMYILALIGYYSNITILQIIIAAISFVYAVIVNLPHLRLILDMILKKN